MASIEVRFKNGDVVEWQLHDAMKLPELVKILILERAVHAVAVQAAATSAIVDEALDAGLDGSHPVTVKVKMLRLELLNVKADLERELGQLVLDRSKCSRRGTRAFANVPRRTTRRSRRRPK